ncbi:MAG TPA: twin-arginine translocase TatA/TatE family subunit [Nitrososphaera sp.]|nr:twin-arginine translocase TatA/TatE family subunit [Nitrososphaera sp.]
MAYENVILIVIAAGIILFGAKKLPDLAKSLGRAQSDYERARKEAAQEIRQMKSQDGSVGREKLEEIADTLGIDYTNKNDDELRAAIDMQLNKDKEKAKA